MIIAGFLFAGIIYLAFGAWVGMLTSGEIEHKIEELKLEGKSDDYIYRYKVMTYKTCIINGPVIYLKGFLGLKR